MLWFGDVTYILNKDSTELNAIESVSDITPPSKLDIDNSV